MKKSPLKRKTALRARAGSSPLARKKPIAKKRRSSSDFARMYGSKQRVAWVKSQCCCICSDVPCENAHYVTGGMGRKADYDKIVPLCRWHHSKLHEMGVQTFQGWFGVNLADEAARIEALWQESVRELEQRREDVSGKA